MTTTKLIGMNAILWAGEYGLRLNKSADPFDGERQGLTVGEALAVADEDPSLIWVEVEDCTDTQIRLLSTSAAEVGDLETVALCSIALTGEISERIDLTAEERAKILQRCEDAGSDKSLARAECARMVSEAENRIIEKIDRLLLQ